MVNYSDLLFEMIKKYAFKNGNYILSSGKRSKYYIDMRQITLSSKGLFLCTELVFDHIKDLDFTAIGGIELSAVPIIGGISLKLHGINPNYKYFVVRKESKNHGTQKLIEGQNLNNNDKVIIVDDVLTTGNSIVKVIDTIDKLNCEIVKVIVLVDRDKGGKELLNKLGIEVESLFTIHDLMK
jgi:orotate phosphoribosyltransferase